MVDGVELGRPLDTERDVISYIACLLNSPLRKETYSHATRFIQKARGDHPT